MDKRLKRMVEMGIIGDFLIAIILLIIFGIVTKFFSVSKIIYLGIYTGIGLSFLRDMVKAIYWSKEEKFEECEESRKEKRY